MVEGTGLMVDGWRLMEHGGASMVDGELRNGAWKMVNDS
jgi:hypothetical protein